MRLTWSGTALDRTSVNLGPLAVFLPLLEQMDVAAIIDRHLPPDPQLEYSHGQVLGMLLAARLCQPLALVNVPGWAEESGAEFLWNIPAEKLNDDRLGRALDAFFRERHSILASVAAHVVSTFRLPLERLHYDTTHLLFCGAYENSQSFPEDLPLPPLTASADFPPAHITHGYITADAKMIHAGLFSVVDDLGAVPLFGNALSGNINSHTAAAQQFPLLQEYVQPAPLLMVSDRGTYSTGHVVRLHQAGHHVLCSVPWREFQFLFDQQRPRLVWKRASFLSVEQRRRRQTHSTLPQEHYELAVLRHQITNPETATPIPARVLFVFSSADQKICQEKRQRAVAKIQAGLERLARTLARGHVRGTDPDSIHHRIAKLFSRRAVARYFHWQLVPLTPEQQAVLPPRPGCRRPKYRLVFHYDAQAAQADAAYDGFSALLTTAPQTDSGDTLFSYFKQQCYVEQSHHQWKGPIAVRPLFLKSPQRVEALVGLLQIALTAYHLLQRLYRQAVPVDAPNVEKRLTTESILRAFRVCPLIKQDTRLGWVVHPVQLSRRQRHILNRLRFPTPAQIICRRLARYPPQ